MKLKIQIRPDKQISIHEFLEIVERNAFVELSAEILERTEKSFNFLKTSSQKIYGIHTGFGPMAEVEVSIKECIQLQKNLIRSHSAGSGEWLSPKITRAILTARLISLSLGVSGIPSSLLHILTLWLNHGIAPAIPRLGGVGASGDLVQLAHLALGLLGEGKIWFQNELKSAAEILDVLNIPHMQIYLREGLALMNGTSAMVGLGILNGNAASNLLHWGIVAGSALLLLAKVSPEAYSMELSEAKKHPGQIAIARLLNFYTQNGKTLKGKSPKFQECYSLRCLPQILGPIHDTLHITLQILESELNSASDNPVIHPEKGIFHGGNFHGEYAAFENDKLKMAVIRLSQLFERQINYLLNPSLNQQFAPFLNRAKLGLNLGMQGVQFTAVAATSENQNLGYPAFLHSITCNNDNQDLVSMGMNAAWLCHQCIENTYVVLSILYLCIYEAQIDRSIPFPAELESAFTSIRSCIPHKATEHDFPRNEILAEIQQKLKKGCETPFSIL